MRMSLTEPFHRVNLELFLSTGRRVKNNGILTLHLHFPRVQQGKSGENKHTTLIRNVVLSLMDWSNRAASNIIWNRFLSFKFPSVFASNINLTETTSSQARIPRSIPRLQTSGKGKACCKEQGWNQSWGIYAQQQAAPFGCLCPSPQMKEPYLPCRHQNQLQIPWGCPKLCSAARGCFLPSSQVSPHRKRLWGTWGREHWGPGSTCSSAPPAAVDALTCSVFEAAICPCPKGAANCINVFRN